MTDIVEVKPLRGQVLVENMDNGNRLVNGIILLDDDAKSHGIRPRWCTVYAVGDGVVDVKVKDIVLISHGQWTRRIEVNTKDGKKFIQKIKPEEILGVCDEIPENYKWNYNTANEPTGN